MVGKILFHKNRGNKINKKYETMTELRGEIVLYMLSLKGAGKEDGGERKWNVY